MPKQLSLIVPYILFLPTFQPPSVLDREERVKVKKIKKDISGLFLSIFLENPRKDLT